MPARIDPIVIVPGEVAVVAVEGEVDFADADDLRAAPETLDADIVVDLSAASSWTRPGSARLWRRAANPRSVGGG